MDGRKERHMIMSNTVAFPQLPFIGDQVFTLDRIAFSIGSLNVAWYGIIIAAGFLLAVLYATRRAPQFNTTADDIYDLLVWALPICVISARLYYVLHRWDYYRQNPGEIIAIWHGGLAIYGAVIAAFLVVAIIGKRRHLNILGLLDIACLGLLIGQMIGRWGNFVNAEAFGSVTQLPWGMSINDGAPVHPTFLYESLWNLLGFIALHFYSHRQKFRGEIALLYLGWYGLGRFWIEGLRTDSLYVANTSIRISQVVALVSLLAAAALLIYFHTTKKYPKPFAAAAEEAATKEPVKEESHEGNNY